jgi:hypothetical protein
MPPCVLAEMMAPTVCDQVIALSRNSAMMAA